MAEDDAKKPEYCGAMKEDFNAFFRRQGMPWWCERRDDWMALLRRAMHVQELLQLVETAWHLNQLLEEHLEKADAYPGFLRQLVRDRNDAYLEHARRLEQEAMENPIVEAAEMFLEMSGAADPAPTN
jgi:hypothetical protein